MAWPPRWIVRPYENLRPYFPILIPGVSLAGTSFLTLTAAFEKLFGWDVWAKHRPGRYGELITEVMAALLISYCLNYRNFLEVRERVRGFRRERRALDDYKKTNDRIMFSGIEEIIRREFQNIATKIPRMADHSDRLPPFYFLPFVFAEQLDGRFHVVAAPLQKSAPQVNQVWARNEGAIPILFDSQCNVLADRRIDPMRVTSLNGLVEFKMGPISEANRAKFAPDATGVVIAPVFNAYEERDDGRPNELVGFITIHSNHPQSVEIFQQTEFAMFVDDIASAIERFLNGYRNFRDLRERLREELRIKEGGHRPPR